MKRWYCALCGNGVLGPQQPDKHDVRRWCLECSAKKGTLVHRYRCASATAAKEAHAQREAHIASRRQSRNEKRAREVARDIRQALGGTHVTTVEMLIHGVTKHARRRHQPRRTPGTKASGAAKCLVTPTGAPRTTCQRALGHRGNHYDRKGNRWA